MRLSTTLGLAAGAAALLTGVDYGRWRDSEGKRLDHGSLLLATARGAVETGQTGQSGHGLPVLIVHGSPGGYDQGLAMATALGLAGCHVVTPSRPGYLRTPLVSGATPAEQAELLVALLDALGLPQTAVVGISGGGPAALVLAQQHPDRCSHLALIEALSDRYTEAQMYAALPPLARIGKRVANRAMQSNVAGYLAVRAAQSAAGGDAVALARSVARYDLRRAGYDNDMAQFACFSAGSVDRLTMPVLLVHGTKDTDVPCEQSRALAARVPQARLVLVEGANHLSLWASPGLPARVADFLGLGG